MFQARAQRPVAYEWDWCCERGKASIVIGNGLLEFGVSVGQTGGRPAQQTNKRQPAEEEDGEARDPEAIDVNSEVSLVWTSLLGDEYHEC